MSENLSFNIFTTEENGSDYDVKDDSLKENAKKMAKEYFATHTSLTKENFTKFFDLLGLSEIWSGEEEKNSVWEAFEKYADNNNEISYESVIKGIDDLFSTNTDFPIDDFNYFENGEVETKNDSPQRTTSNFGMSPEKENHSLPSKELEDFIQKEDNEEVLRKLKIINLIYLNDGIIDSISSENVLAKLEEYKFIQFNKNFIEEYLSSLRANKTIDAGLLRKSNELINEKLQTFRFSMKTDTAGVSYDNLSGKGLVNTLIGSEDISIEYITSLNNLTSTGCNTDDKKELLDEILKSFCKLIRSKNSIYRVLLSKVATSPKSSSLTLKKGERQRTKSQILSNNVDYFIQSSPLYKLQNENITLHRIVNNLKTKYDMVISQLLKKQNIYQITDEIQFECFGFGYESRKSLSAPKHKLPGFSLSYQHTLNRQPSPTKNDLVKCLTCNTNKYLTYSSSYNDTRKRTETEIKKRRRKNKSSIFNSNSSNEDLLSKRDYSKLDISYSQNEIFSASGGDDKFFFETDELDPSEYDTSINNCSTTLGNRHRDVHIINSYIDQDFPKEILENASESDEERKASVDGVNSKNNNCQVVNDNCYSKSTFNKESPIKNSQMAISKNIINFCIGGSKKKEERKESEPIKERISINQRSDLKKNENEHQESSLYNSYLSHRERCSYISVQAKGIKANTSFSNMNDLSYFCADRDNMVSNEHNTYSYYDFLNLRKSKMLLPLLKYYKDELVPNELFSGYVFYLEENLKKTRMILVMTSNNFYLLDSVEYQCKFRASRCNLKFLEISSKNCNLAQFHFDNDKTVIIESLSRMEILYYLRDLYRYKNFGKLRLKYPNNFKLKNNKGNVSTISTTNDKLFQLTPNFENAQKIGYLYKYKQDFFSASFSEKLVVLCSIGLLFFEDPSKPPKKIIPIVGTIVKTFKCKKGGITLYCFKLETINNEEHIFGSKNIQEIKDWVSELNKFKDSYKLRMKGVEMGSMTLANSSINCINNNN